MRRLSESARPVWQLLAAAAILCAVAPAKAAEKKPNIVFMLMDNLGYGELGVYGGGILRGAPTPRIDKLASEGMRLLNFNVEAQCTPSRSALMTGRFSIRSGTYEAPIGCVPDGLTLPTYHLRWFTCRHCRIRSVPERRAVLLATEVGDLEQVEDRGLGSRRGLLISSSLLSTLGKQVELGRDFSRRRRRVGFARGGPGDAWPLAATVLSCAPASFSLQLDLASVWCAGGAGLSRMCV